MRILKGMIGLALLILGIYFLGQNIIFTTHHSPYWWRDLSATGTVLTIAAGLLSLMFFGREGRFLGWGLVGLGIVLAIASGGLVIRPTSLWTFFVAMMSFMTGFQLLRTGRVRF